MDRGSSLGTCCKATSMGVTPTLRITSCSGQTDSHPSSNLLLIEEHKWLVLFLLLLCLDPHTSASARPLAQNFSSFCGEIIRPPQTRWGFKGSSATVEFAVHPASPIWGLTLVNAGCSTLEVLACEEKAEGKGLWTRLAKVRELANILALIESRKHASLGVLGGRSCCAGSPDFLRRGGRAWCGWTAKSRLERPEAGGESSA